MEELLDCVQLNADCKQLLQFWQEYGHGTEQLEKRKRTVNKYTRELFKDMVHEEEKRVLEKKSEICKIRTDIKQLSVQLDMPYDENLSGENLLATIDILGDLKSALNKTKEEKMKDWIEAKKREDQLCSELDEVSTVDIIDRIPTNAEVADLNNHIAQLIQDKKGRIESFHELSEAVIKSLELLEKPPSTQVDRTLTSKHLDLSKKFLASATARRNELIQEYAALQSKWDPLLQEVNELWKRLEIADIDRIDFGADARPTQFEKMQTEHARLLILKKANLKSFITKLRGEIETTSAACYRKIILPIEVETDECLEEHEQLLSYMMSYKDQNQAVLNLIEKRNDVFLKWKECEMKADDPSRFNNRGGNLLKEEKIRKQLQKQLPKMEKEIEAFDFKIWDVTVSNWLKKEWDEWNQLREETKRKKKEEAAAVGGFDMNTTRKRPATPLMGQTNKRTRGTPLTPRKNPVVFDPATTYSDFQNHNIFQSTMNKGDPTSGVPPKSPGRGLAVPPKSPIRGGTRTALKFTTPKTTRLNENF